MLEDLQTIVLYLLLKLVFTVPTIVSETFTLIFLKYRKILWLMKGFNFLQDQLSINNSRFKI